MDSEDERYFASKTTATTTRRSNELYPSSHENPLQRSTSQSQAQPVPEVQTEHTTAGSVPLVLNDEAASTIQGDREQVSEKLQRKDGHLTDDGSTIIVDWDGPDDPENPKKFVSTILVLLVSCSCKCFNF